MVAVASKDFAVGLKSVFSDSKLLYCLSFDSNRSMQASGTRKMYKLHEHGKFLMQEMVPVSGTRFSSICHCCRPYLSCDDCLEDKSEDYQNCSVLYCIPQLYTVISTHTYEQFLQGY